MGGRDWTHPLLWGSRGIAVEMGLGMTVERSERMLAGLADVYVREQLCALLCW